MVNNKVAPKGLALVAIHCPLLGLSTFPFTNLTINIKLILNTSYLLEAFVKMFVFSRANDSIGVTTILTK